MRGDAIEAIAVLVEAASSGQIWPSEAAALTGPITAYARIVDAAEVEERLEKLEKILARIGLEKGNGEKTTAFFPE